MVWPPGSVGTCSRTVPGTRFCDRIDAFAFEALNSTGIDTSTYRSRSRGESGGDGVPPLPIVIAACDSAAAEQRPVSFGGTGGQPAKVHWSCSDPSNAEGDEGKRRAFELNGKRSAIACCNRWRCLRKR